MARICTLPDDYWNNMYQYIKRSPQIDAMDISANELSDTFKGEYCTSQSSSSTEFASSSSMSAALNERQSLHTERQSLNLRKRKIDSILLGL